MGTTIRGKWLIPLGLAVSLIAARGGSPPPATLLDAAKNQDWDGLRVLLEDGADVNASQGDGATALHWASYWDDLGSVALLIRAGADVNAANDLGVTPLWLAAENGSAAVVRELLGARANPNAAFMDGETVLMRAARVGNGDVVEQLLANGADPNRSATRGQTALMWAANQQHDGVVEALLANGADVHARSEVRRELRRSESQQHSHRTNDFWVDEGGATAFLFAVRVGDLTSAKLFLAAGADVDDQGASGVSATVLAAHAGHADMVDLLLENGADPNAAGAGYTALHAAILRRSERAVRALLAHGADPNASVLSGTPVRRSSDDFYIHTRHIGTTPFWMAANFNQPEIMRLLAAHGADPLFEHYIEYWEVGSPGQVYNNTLYTAGNTTALMAAVALGGRRPDRFARPDVREVDALRLETVQLCVELGVDVNAANAEGSTALDQAMEQGWDSVVEFLLENGATAGRGVSSAGYYRRF